MELRLFSSGRTMRFDERRHPTQDRRLEIHGHSGGWLIAVAVARLENDVRIVARDVDNFRSDRVRPFSKASPVCAE